MNSETRTQNRENVEDFRTKWEENLPIFRKFSRVLGINSEKNIEK